MFVVRPSRLSDLDQVERMAASTYPMLHTLPANRDKLREKIAQSCHSFEADVDFPGEESYFFVLEDAETGRLHGTGAIVASAGFSEAFYAYRNDVIVHASRELKVHTRIHALTLSYALTGHTQLTSFYVDSEVAKTDLPHLLSRARLMFVAQHPQRFADDLMVALPGVSDEQGHSPFWENLGRKFFGLEFRQAEFLSGGRSKTFIAELMPHHPIYVSLLSEEAQTVMGQVHPGSQLPFSILSEEGFEADNFIDIFDGGPVLYAKRSICRTVRNSVTRPILCRAGAAAPLGPWHIVCNTAAKDFRCLLLRLPAELPPQLEISSAAADSLELEDGDEVRCVRLHSAE